MSATFAFLSLSPMSIVLLLIVGVLLVTGVWGDLMGWLRNELAVDLRLPL